MARAQAEVLAYANDHCKGLYNDTDYMNQRAINLMATDDPANTRWMSNFTCIANWRIGGSQATYPTTQNHPFYYNLKGCNSRGDNTESGPSLAVVKCIAGCKMQLATGYSTRQNANLSDGTTHTLYYGILEYTGDTCTSGTPGPNFKEESKPLEQECKPAGSGQSYCVNKQGNNCYTASSGRMVCWTPNQTGEAPDGTIIQVAASGNTPPATPLTPPPPGNTFNQGPGSTNVTTTTTNSTTNVVNVTNFSTSAGAPAGNTNAGQNNTGQSGNGQSSGGNNGGSEGGEEGNTGTGSPSVDCNVSPQCSSGDSIGCAMLRQSWMEHCKLKTDLEASGDEGSHKGAADSYLDGLVGDADPGSNFSEENEGLGDLLGQVDTGGLGGRGTCPVNFTFSAFGRSYEVDDHLCLVLDALAALISFLAVFHSGIILFSGSRR